MNKKTLAFTIGLTILSLMSTNTKAVDQGTMDKLNKYPVVRKELKEFSRPININLQKGDQVIRIDNKFKDGVRVLDGRTSIGVRDLVNAIEGAEVTWNQQNKIVDIVKDGKNIAYPLNRMAMYDGNAIVTMDTIAGVDPKISRTFVPIRNLAESLGYEVDWDNATSTVTLRTPGSKPIAKPQENTQAQKPQATVGKGGTAPVPYGPKKVVMSQSAGRKVVGKSIRGTEYLGFLPGEVVDNGDGTSTYFRGTNIAGYLHNPYKKVDKSSANPNFNVFGPNSGDNRVGTAVITKGNRIWESIKEFQIGNAKNAGTYNKIIDESIISLDCLKANEYFKGAENNLFKGRKLNKVDSQKLDTLMGQHKWALKSAYEGEWYDATGIVDTRVRSIGVFNRSGNNTFNLSTNTNTMIGAFIDINGNFYGVNSDSEFIFPKEGYVIIDKLIVNTTYQNLVVDVPNIRVEAKDRGNFTEAFVVISDNFAGMEGTSYER